MFADSGCCWPGLLVADSGCGQVGQLVVGTDGQAIPWRWQAQLHSSEPPETVVLFSKLFKTYNNVNSCQSYLFILVLYWSKKTKNHRQKNQSMEESENADHEEDLVKSCFILKIWENLVAL